MGEFHVTHRYILNNDVRYLYSGLPLDLVWRGSPDYPNFDMLRLRRESTKLKQTVLKSSEYNMFKTLLPRAPAFRCVPPDHANKIVKRVTNPSRFTPRKIESWHVDRTRFPSYKRLPGEDVERLSSRLHRNHTIMSQMKLAGSDPLEIPMQLSKTKMDTSPALTSVA